jgi:hypothetical protein
VAAWKEKGKSMLDNALLDEEKMEKEGVNFFVFSYNCSLLLLLLHHRRPRPPLYSAPAIPYLLRAREGALEQSAEFDTRACFCNARTSCRLLSPAPGNPLCPLMIFSFPARPNRHPETK